MLSLSTSQSYAAEVVQQKIIEQLLETGQLGTHTYISLLPLIFTSQVKQNLGVLRAAIHRTQAHTQTGLLWVLLNFLFPREYRVSNELSKSATWDE